MNADRTPKKISTMFDRLSPRYDLLNRIISGGRDMSWRRHAVDMLGDLTGKTALDLCCGSGDFIGIFLKRYRNDITVYGADFSTKMLAVARRKFADNTGKLVLLNGDAMYLPFVDNTVDAVTIGFGIRNVADRDKALKEISRVLRPGGRLAMIEPADPPNRLVRAAFRIYFKYISPLIGGIIAGDRAAYRYLHDSFVEFPAPEEFLAMMRRAGFSNEKAVPQTFGTAMIYYGEKLK